jgi:hypothetical protein
VELETVYLDCLEATSAGNGPPELQKDADFGADCSLRQQQQQQQLQQHWLLTVPVAVTAPGCAWSACGSCPCWAPRQLLVNITLSRSNLDGAVVDLSLAGTVLLLLLLVVEVLFLSVVLLLMSNLMDLDSPAECHLLVLAPRSPQLLLLPLLL